MKKIILLMVLIFILMSGTLLFFLFKKPERSTIKVGILHSRSGTMAVNEEPVIYATLLAIEEINKNGGVLGKLIEPIIADGKSDERTFARQAEKLIKEDEVTAIFGCWTSSCRKAVKPIIEKFNTFLFYPVQCEGVESSPVIVYAGAIPNQQVLPGMIWAVQTLGKKIFLTGSDYIYPHVCNEIIKQLSTILGATIVGEEYVKLGSENVLPMIEKIKLQNPDIIINTINGDTNIPFFREMHKQLPNKIPILSFSVSETDIQLIGIENIINNYMCWNYFESIDSEQNHQFVQLFKNKYGESQKVTDPMFYAFFNVYLWAKAAENGKSFSTESIRDSIPKIIIPTPAGLNIIDKATLATWSSIYIGKVNAKGGCDIIWSTNMNIRPDPYLEGMESYLGQHDTKKNKEWWDTFIQNLYKKWGNQWSAS